MLAGGRLDAGERKAGAPGLAVVLEYWQRRRLENTHTRHWQWYGRNTDGGFGIVNTHSRRTRLNGDFAASASATSSAPSCSRRSRNSPCVNSTSTVVRLVNTSCTFLPATASASICRAASITAWLRMSCSVAVRLGWVSRTTVQPVTMTATAQMTIQRVMRRCYPMHPPVAMLIGRPSFRRGARGCVRRCRWRLCRSGAAPCRARRCRQCPSAPMGCHRQIPRETCRR